MAFIHRIIQSVQTGGRLIERYSEYTGGSQQSISEAIPAPSTDLLVNFAVDVSTIKSIYMVSDQDITIETNNATSPSDTIALLAGEPYIWHTGSLDTNLLTTDVTKLYVTKASGTAATLEIEVVTDPTP